MVTVDLMWGIKCNHFTGNKIQIPPIFPKQFILNILSERSHIFAYYQKVQTTVFFSQAPSTNIILRETSVSRPIPNQYRTTFSPQVAQSWYLKLTCKRKLASRIAKKSYLKPFQKLPEDGAVLTLNNSSQMLQPTLKTPHYLIHLQDLPPVSHFLQALLLCKVPTSTVKLISSKQQIKCNISLLQQQDRFPSQLQHLNKIQMSLSTWDPVKVAPCPHFKHPLQHWKQSITVKLHIGVRWQHDLNASKVKTSADSSLQCHSIKAKSWQTENPDECLLPSRPRKELMKRCSV